MQERESVAKNFGCYIFDNKLKVDKENLRLKRDIFVSQSMNQCESHEPPGPNEAAHATGEKKPEASKRYPTLRQIQEQGHL